MDILHNLTQNPVRYGHLMGFDRLTEVHNEWLRKIIFGDSDWTLQAFRGSYKTTTVSVALALITILMPNLKCAFIRKTDTDVKEVISQVQKMLERKETKAITSAIWGQQIMLVKANQTEITSSLATDPRGAAQLTGMGISGSLTGKHYDLIITDDIVNLKDRVSRAEREHTKSVYMELQNVKNRGGRILNTGTPWHVEDCFSIMPEAEKWDYRSMPDIFTDEDAASIKQKMTPSLWAANYELRHIPSDDVIFTDPQTGAPQSMIENGTAHVDAAYYGDDWTAFTIAARHDGKYYIYGRCWRKHVDDCMSMIADDWKKFNCSRLWMETNSDKGYSARSLKENFGVRTATYAEKMNKHIKIVTYLKTVWQDVVFVEGTDQAYINQICDYTEDAEHDDCPDSCASIIRKIGKKSDDSYTSVFSDLKRPYTEGIMRQ